MAYTLVSFSTSPTEPTLSKLEYLRQLATLLLTSACGLVAAQAPGSPPFESSTVLEPLWQPGGGVSGYGYSPIEIVDWNLDGQLDIITASEPMGAIWIHEGNGSGGFQTISMELVSMSPTAVVAADFNEDGKPDLAICNGSAGTVTICNTTHALYSYVLDTIPTGSRPVRAYAADLTEDGHQDLVVVDEIDSTVSLLVGNGLGSFAAPQVSFIEIDDSLEAVSIDDINSDGHLDLVVPCPAMNLVAVLLAESPGSFESPVIYPVGPNPGPIAVEDFDGDSHKDLLVPNRFEPSLSWLRGNGDGTFLPAQMVPSPSLPVSARAVSNSDGRVFGTYPHANLNSLSVVYSLSPLGTETSATYSTSSIVDWVESADFNGDGLGDLAVVSRDTGTIEILLQSAESLPFRRGDVNNDGWLNIADIIESLQSTFNPHGIEIDCSDRYDANDDGIVNILDPVIMLESLFLSSGPLPTPSLECGSDPTDDALPPCRDIQECVR